VLGIVIALVMVYLFTRYLKEERDRQSEMTREVTAALMQSSSSNEKLSLVLDKNLQKMEDVSTKNDINESEARLVRLHNTTHAKLDSIKKEISK
jgi:hypothetical protein